MLNHSFLNLNKDNYAVSRDSETVLEATKIEQPGVWLVGLIIRKVTVTNLSAQALALGLQHSCTGPLTLTWPEGKHCSSLELRLAFEIKSQVYI